MVELGKADAHRSYDYQNDGEPNCVWCRIPIDLAVRTGDPYGNEVHADGDHSHVGVRVPRHQEELEGARHLMMIEADGRQDRLLDLPRPKADPYSHSGRKSDAAQYAFVCISVQIFHPWLKGFRKPELLRCRRLSVSASARTAERFSVGNRMQRLTPAVGDSRHRPVVFGREKVAVTGVEATIDVGGSQ